MNRIVYLLLLLSLLLLPSGSPAADPPRRSGLSWSRRPSATPCGRCSSTARNRGSWRTPVLTTDVLTAEEVRAGDGRKLRTT